MAKTSANPKRPVMFFAQGKWQLKRKVIVKWKNFEFTVPKDYRCDLGSVPWLFTGIVQSTGVGNLGFLCHDYCYDKEAPALPDKDGVPITREQADSMMRELLIYSGLSSWRAFVAWRGVRRGGWFSWKAG